MLDSRREEPSLLLVLKWGGELTPAGRVQAEELGRAFRCMYPGGQGKPGIFFTLDCISIIFQILIYSAVIKYRNNSETKI